MNQALALEIMLEGKSVLLTGPAGSGKTFVLNEFIRLAKRDGKSVAVTATTGLAASHLGGSTIHAWSGLGIHQNIPKNFFSNLSKTRRETIEKADVLIIDEISMLHDYRLDMIDTVTQKVRGKAEPFGGLQFILCGDFFQLPPVNRADEPEGGFVVNSNAWQQLNPIICYLEEQHRQDDNNFLEILNALRAGDIRRRHAEALLLRVDANLPNNQEVTELHTTNINVDRINESRLAQIQGDAYRYQMQTTGNQNYVEALKRSCLAPEELLLKEGALVMCIKNSPDKKYANGSLGVVTGFDEATNYPKVKLRNGRELIITPESWELRDGDKKRAGLTQLPLRLAWAITVHKSQGMTLDAAKIDLRRAFVEGMGYVALSRVKRLDSLSLAGINNMALKVSSEALKIDQYLKAESEHATKKFGHLQEVALARKTKVEEDKPKKSVNPQWAEKLAKMREEYPRAFMPWAKVEDQKLLDLFDSCKDISKLCEEMQRQPGGIIARLNKHLGEEKVSALMNANT